jgi:hypothetical protein
MERKTTSGADDEVLSVVLSEQPVTTGRPLLQWLGELSDTVETFRNLMFFANRSERSTIEIPWEFTTAWIYFLATIIPYSENNYQNERSFIQSSQTFNRLLHRGMRIVVEGLRDTSLTEYRVLMPWGLVSLINLTLLEDVTPPQSDTNETYQAYLRRLVGLTRPPSGALLTWCRFPRSK